VALLAVPPPLAYHATGVTDKGGSALEENPLEHCATKEDYRELLRSSGQSPVFLLKHSITCGISAMAREDFQGFDEEAGGCECWELTVQSSRDLSNLVARETGIRHESPQVILFRDGTPVWHASHGQIRLENLREALKTH